MRGSRHNAEDTGIAAMTVLFTRIIAFALRTVPPGYWHHGAELADDVMQEFISFVALVFAVIVDAGHQLFRRYRRLIVFKPGSAIPFMAYQQRASAAYTEAACSPGFRVPVGQNDFSGI
jgi:hypothetical protein